MVDDLAARKTYRYVRIGMVGAVVLLAASVLLEHRRVGPRDCWQTSISAYYFTPVRAIFVGVLMAVGLSLIVIKGSTEPEDLCLNLAGMLAPVVALVPTSDDGGRCWSEPPTSLPIVKDLAGHEHLASWVVADIRNNVTALLCAGFIGLAAAAVIAALAVAVGRRRGERRSMADAWTKENRGSFLSLLVALGILSGGALVFLRYPTGFEVHAHLLTAGAMFAVLAVVAAINAIECRRAHRLWYFRLYLGIAALMAAAAGLLALRWKHKLFATEVIEITLFAAFWLVQTRELWNDTLRTSPPRRV